MSRFQAIWSGIPVKYLGILPYVATVIALAIIACKGGGPVTFGRPYRREDE
ncbi:MAG: hypothetical protein MUO76_02420 [Anaerolineaceae bacterium]|nr:hypothetical protein [Anaerolineaceae bacterium]